MAGGRSSRSVGMVGFIPVAAFVILVARHEAVRALGRQARRAADFYERGLARIEDRWTTLPSDRVYTAFDDSHPYAIDLDIFGKSSLFQLLSQALRGPANRHWRAG